MPMPAKRIQLLLPVLSSTPKMTSATSSSTLIAQSHFHWSASRSASMTVRTTKAMMPSSIENSCTTTSLVGLISAPEATMPEAARYTITVPNRALKMQMPSSTMSAR